MWQLAKQILYTVAAFAAGYGAQMILTGHDTSIVFSWSAVINGLLVSGVYHSGQAVGSIDTSTQPK